MALTNVWQGAVTETSARVVAKITGASARLAIADNPDLAAPAFSAAVAPTAQGVCQLDATGLDPSTRYWWGVEEDGVLRPARGRFRTPVPVGEPTATTFIVSGCAGLGTSFPAEQGLAPDRVSNHPIFSTIADRSPDFMAHLGDLHYYDPGSGVHVPDASLVTYRDAYDTVLSTVQADLYRRVPLVYVWDDHDYGPNNSDKTAPGRDNACLVYRERVPHHTLGAGAGANPIYHAFERGRVLYLVSDTRSDRDPSADPAGPGKTMLGTAQKTWMEGVLATSAAKYLVWLMPTPWMSTAADAWASYTHERDELVQMLGDHRWLHRMAMVGSDTHNLAMDTGGGNTSGRFPVAQFGSLDSNPGNINLQYDLGPSLPGRAHHGVVSVVDTGDYLLYTGSGWTGQGTQHWHTYSTFAPDSPVVPMLSATYDTDLSRVQLTGSGFGGDPIDDTFTRAEIDGWGLADTGQAWTVAGGDAADYTVTTGVGRIALPTSGTRHFATTGDFTAVDLYAEVIPPVDATGGNYWEGLVARFNGTNDYYLSLCAFGPSGLTFTLWKRVVGSNSQLATGIEIPYSAGQSFSVRLQVVGSELRTKLWAQADPEPSAWTLEATDTAFDSGAVGCYAARANSNTNGTVTTQFDNVHAFVPVASGTMDRRTDSSAWQPVRGGTDLAIGPTTVVKLDDYEFAPDVVNHYRLSTFSAEGFDTGVYTTSITTGLTKTWLKFLDKPFLNQPVTVSHVSEVTQAANNSTYHVMGSRYPVAVTDVRSGREYVLTILTESPQQADDLELALTPGTPVFVHVPTSSNVPDGYFLVGDTVCHRYNEHDERTIELPLTEVAPPGPDVIGATVTWQGVGNDFGTWDDVIAAEATWASTLERIGEPTDVIVG